MRRRIVTPFVGAVLAGLLLAVGGAPAMAAGDVPANACVQIQKAANRAAQAHDGAGAAKLLWVFAQRGCTPV